MGKESKVAYQITEDDMATLCRIFGVRDPGQDVVRATFVIDWGTGEASAQFLYGIRPQFDGTGEYCRAYMAFRKENPEHKP